MKAVIMVEDADYTTGYELIGPFDSVDEAAAWAAKHMPGEHWAAAGMYTPGPDAEAAMQGKGRP